MDAISEVADKLANSLQVLSTAATIDRPALASGFIERIAELADAMTREKLDEFAIVGEPGDAVAVGETWYASAHHATLGEARLALEILERSAVAPHNVESEWAHARSVILEWLGEDWRRQFRPVAARLKRETASRRSFSGADKETGDTDAAPAAGDDPLPAGLDRNAVAVLFCLLNRSPELLTLDDIVVAAKVSRDTASKSLNELIGDGLAHRPKGDRKGATVTDEGRTVATLIRH